MKPWRKLAPNAAGLLLLPVVLWTSGSSEAAGPRLIERDKVALLIRPLTASAVDLPPQGYRMEVCPDRPSSLEMTLHWPDTESTVRVRLEASSEAVGPGEHVVRLDATFEIPRGTTRQHSRTIAVAGDATALFEIHRDGERALTLAIEGRIEAETVVEARPSAGAPVQFVLEVQRVQGGQAFPLETNQLHTFEGESVGYEFRLGQSGESDALSVRLNPARRHGDLLELEVEVTGSLPGARGATLISRRERWMTNPGARSSLTVEAGDPPAGYRFIVTPRF